MMNLLLAVGVLAYQTNMRGCLMTFSPLFTGVLTEEERSIIKDVQGRTTKSVKWLPLTWSIKLLKEMRRKKFIGIFI